MVYTLKTKYRSLEKNLVFFCLISFLEMETVQNHFIFFFFFLNFVFWQNFASKEIVGIPNQWLLGI
jgi:hypothetical protein